MFKWLLIAIAALITFVVGSWWLTRHRAEAALLEHPVYRVVRQHAPGVYQELLEEYLTYQRDEESRDRIHRPGTLYAAGLITGEALMGIAIAIPIVVTERADVLALPEGLVPGGAAGQWLGLAVLAGVGWLLYRISTRRQPAE